MNEAKRKRLEEKDWKVGAFSDCLELTLEETVPIEIKLVLSRNLKPVSIAMRRAAIARDRVICSPKNRAAIAALKKGDRAKYVPVRVTHKSKQNIVSL